jgi:hypothetical protein
MVALLTSAWCLLAVTVLIHALGLAYVLRSPALAAEPDGAGFGAMAWLLIRVAWAFIVLHLAEIAVWALFYWWQACLPSAESAFYFSAVTYATVGYGDLTLPVRWRLLGPIEGLTGILMCGLSTGVVFAIVNRRYARMVRAATGPSG